MVSVVGKKLKCIKLYHMGKKYVNVWEDARVCVCARASTSVSCTQWGSVELFAACFIRQALGLYLKPL